MSEDTTLCWTAKRASMCETLELCHRGLILEPNVVAVYTNTSNLIMQVIQSVVVIRDTTPKTNKALKTTEK